MSNTTNKNEKPTNNANNLNSQHLKKKHSTT